MNLVVCQLPATPFQAQPMLPVGVLRFDRQGPRLAIIVKATFSFGAEGAPAVLAPEQLPLTGALPSTPAGASEGELHYPSDFVPFKPSCDVLLVGHAHAPEPAVQLSASIRVADVQRSFCVVSDSPVRSAPLCGPGLRAVDGQGPTEPVGPRAVADVDDAGGRGLDRHCSAAPSSRTLALSPYDTIVLEGVNARAVQRAVQLPGLAPQAWVQSTDGQERRVELRCDTLWIDTDEEQLVLVWRGHIASSKRDRRIVLSLDRADSPRPWSELRGAIERGRFSPIVEEKDLTQGHAPLGAAASELAGYELWPGGAPEPSISLRRYAHISAVLAEQREERSHTLERFGIDERTWALEERAWLEAMGRRAAQGDPSLAVQYGQLFMAAQDGLAGAGEAGRSLEEYVAVRADIEAAHDPQQALASRSMTLAEWFRLDRRYRQLAAHDPEVDAELRRRLRDERAARAASDTSE